MLVAERTHRPTLLEIDEQVKALDEIRGWTETIKSNGQKILDRMRISTEKLEKQGVLLTGRVEDLKEAMAKGQKQEATSH